METSVPHQFGAISGTPISSKTVRLTGATSPTSAVWRTPGRNLFVSVQKPGDLERVSLFPSPPVSQIKGCGLRPDLSVACQAFASEIDSPMVDFEIPKMEKKGKDEVPVFVMMPLDSVKLDNTVNRRKAMNASLQALKSVGVEGIMMDVWWGLVEREAPGEYNWVGYIELMETVKKHGLKKNLFFKKRHRGELIL